MPRAILPLLGAAQRPARDVGRSPLIWEHSCQNVIVKMRWRKALYSNVFETSKVDRRWEIWENPMASCTHVGASCTHGGAAIHASNGAFSKNIKIFKIIELLEEYEHFRKRANIEKKKSRLRRGKMFFL